jgi:hypothetical protein
VKRRRFKRHPPGEGFSLIPFGLLLSLPEQHLAVLLDMARRHNGHNNGRIGYGCRDAAKAARTSPTRGGRILNELSKQGTVKRTRAAAFNMKAGRTTCEWEIPVLEKKKSPFTEARRLMLDYWLLDAPAFMTLTPSGKKLLVELERRFDGGNNGCIVFGVEDGTFIGFSRSKTGRVLAELQARGWIAETDAADPAHGKRRRWRLTRYPAQGQKATKEFMGWSPKKSFHGNQDGTDAPICVTMVGSSNVELAPDPATRAPGNNRNTKKDSEISHIPDSPAVVTLNVLSSPIPVTHIESQSSKSSAVVAAPPSVVPLPSARPAAARRARYPSKRRGLL